MQNEILKKVLKKRVRVSTKLSFIANDIAARGRRHDNSYTDATEMALLTNIESEKNPIRKEELTKVLDGIHSNANDYTLGFHNNDISKMNMIQLLEFIAHRVSEYDVILINPQPEELPGYVDYVLDGIEVSDDLRGVIASTVHYFVDRTNAIRMTIPKPINELAAKELEKSEEM